MIALDTNILARFYIDETEPEAKKQHALAKRIMAKPALFVARTVVLELEWVMRGGYGYSRDEVAAVLDHLLGLPNVNVENWEMMMDALSAYKSGLDFADALHLATGDCEKFVTFDAKFAKLAQKKKLKPDVVVVNK